MCGCLSQAPYWGPGPQPRHVLWLGIELVTLCFTGWYSIHWATPAREQLYISKWRFEHSLPEHKAQSIRIICMCSLILSLKYEHPQGRDYIQITFFFLSLVTERSEGLPGWMVSCNFGYSVVNGRMISQVLHSCCSCWLLYLWQASLLIKSLFPSEFISGLRWSLAKYPRQSLLVSQNCN